MPYVARHLHRAPGQARTARLRATFAVVAISLGFGLLGAAWAGSNPPGASPDEPAHYVKAVATAEGELVGTPVAPAPPGAPATSQYLARATRTYSIPSRLEPPPIWTCEASTGRSAACLHAQRPPSQTTGEAAAGSYSGLYPPSGYVVYGLAARVGTTPDTALYLGRGAGVLCCTVLLSLAVRACDAAWIRVGLIAAASPMAVFLAASLNPNGLEIAASIATASTGLALLRHGPTAPRWTAFAVSGAALALSRQLGPLEVAVDLVVLVALAGGGGLRRVLAHRRQAAIALPLVGIAAGAVAAWDIAHPIRGTTGGPITSATLHLAWHHVWLARVELFGAFGWFDTFPPAWATDAALSAYVLLIAASIVLGRWRQRVVLVLLCAATIAFAMAIDLLTQIPNGFGLQGRYVMPLTSMVLVVAAAIIGDRLGARARVVPVIAALGLAGLGAVGWWSNARQAAGGRSGPIAFWLHPQWSPPGGWTPWIAAAAAGTLLVVVGTIVGAGQRALTPPRATSPG